VIPPKFDRDRYPLKHSAAITGRPGAPYSYLQAVLGTHSQVVFLTVWQKGLSASDPLSLIPVPVNTRPGQRVTLLNFNCIISRFGELVNWHLFCLSGLKNGLRTSVFTCYSHQKLCVHVSSTDYHCYALTGGLRLPLHHCCDADCGCSLNGLMMMN